MEYRRCGRSGLRLPAISLGFWHNFGAGCNFGRARQIVLTAFEQGSTHFDLADNYGPPAGSAEETFGRILRNSLAAHRDEMLITTKAGHEMWPGPYGDWGSRKHLVAACDQSLRRLGLDYVDIFYSHRPDPETPLEETMQALDYIVRSGRALYVGLSKYPPETARRAMDILRQLGTPCVVHQLRYSMLVREPEKALFPLFDEYGTGVVSFSPLAQLNAWADGTKPWSFPEVYEACREVATLRMQLLPYLYSIFAQYYLEGLPPFRAMNLINGFDGKVKRIKGTLDATDNPYEMVTIREVTDQYMMGNDLLVAPLFAGEKERRVVFPAGDKWYDFYTGAQVAEGGDEVTIQGTLDRIPLFVRDGALIPMIPAIRTTAEWEAGQPLEVRVYGTKGGSFDLYDDDGKSFDYEKGKYTLKRLTVSAEGNPSVEDVVTDGGWSYGPVTWRTMSR